MIKENNIELKLHQFIQENSNYLFYSVNSREKDLDASGIKNLFRLLVSEYDSIQYGVSTNLKHKLVYEKIQEISKIKQVEGKSTHYNETSFSILGFKLFGESNQVLKTDENKISIEIDEESKPIIDLQFLRKEIEKMKENVYSTQSLKELESILTDLHKLGVIVYFDHPILKDVIISNPQFFNKITKVFLDYGRQIIQTNLEKVFGLYPLENNNQFFLFKTVVKSKKYLEGVIDFIKGKCDKKLTISEIWTNGIETEKSNVDKISYYTLLSNLNELKFLLLKEQENKEILEELNKLDTEKNLYTIDHNQLDHLAIIILGDKYRNNLEKRKFLIELLCKFDIILPKGKNKK